MFSSGSMTEMLAQIYGLAFVAAGIGIFTSRDLYGRMMAELSSGALLIYLSGLMAFVLGAVTVTLHNDWSGAPSIVITAIGWLAVIEGLLLIAVPRIYLVLISGIKPRGPLLPALAIISIAVGAWLLGTGMDLL